MTPTSFIASLERLSIGLFSAALCALSLSCSASPAPQSAAEDAPEDDFGELETPLTRACTAKISQILPAPRQPVPSSGVTLSGTGTCMAGIAPEFRFSVVRNGSAQVVCDWQKGGTCNWDTTLALPDYYKVVLETRRPGQVATEGSASRVYAVGAVCTGVALQVTPGAEGLVALNATATCDPGIAPLYRFDVKAPGGVWKSIAAYGPSSTTTWDSSGAAPGRATFRVYVRRPEDPGQDVFRQTAYDFGAACTASSLAIGGKGTARAMIATAGCGADATPQYRFSVEDPAGGVSVVRDWAAESSTNWDVTGLNGRYQAIVEVRATENPSLGPSRIKRLVALGTACQVSVSVPDGVLPTDAAVTFSASTTCPSPELAFLVHPSTDSRLTLACEYGTASTCTWQPPAGALPGQYSVVVRVRRAGGSLLQSSQAVGFSLGGSARCLANDQCPVDELCLGGAAKRVCIEPTLRCVEGQPCPSGFFCDDGTCEAAAAVGEPCSTGGRCAVGAYCAEDGTCSPSLSHLEQCSIVYPPGPAEQCEAGTVCRYAIGSNVARCFAPGDAFTCRGVICVGDFCSEDDCGPNATCANAQCLPDLALGQTGCWHGGRGPFCGPGLYCKTVDKVDGVCELLPGPGSPCQGATGRLGYSAPCAPGSTCVSKRCLSTRSCGEDCSVATCSPGLSCVGGVENGACFEGHLECGVGFANVGGVCKDINECATGVARCGSNATCTNLPGSFSCSCNPGYAGDGSTCTDIDECATSQDDCSSNATCTNTPGSFSCSCDENYKGDGRTCTCEPPAAICQSACGGSPGVCSKCTYLDVDRTNCGACGVSCAVDQVCDGGTCVRSDWIAFDGGQFFTCAVRSDASLVCWGADYHGLTQPPIGKFSAVGASGYHACGLRADQTVVCWGQYPNDFSGAYTAVSVGYNSYACALRTDQTLACWGFPWAAPPAGTFSAVSATAEGGCGVRTDQTLACWGNNRYGQATPPSGTFLAVTSGYLFSCGLRTDRTVACWGYNTSGQATPPSGTFTAVSAGSSFACGIRTDQTLACWGHQESGQTQPPSGTYSSLATGVLHACALRTDGHLACWGTDLFGETDVPAP